MTYESNTTWPVMADALRAASRVAIVTHVKPDGDAVGSMLALCRGLGRLGKTVEGFLMGPVEPPLLRLCGPTTLRNADVDPPGDDYDRVIVLDTGSWTQLEPLVSWLRRHHEHVLGLDHHARGDDVAALRMVDASAAAAAVLAVRLLDELGVELTGGANGIAEPLFVGLATDTGWFRYPNADAASFALASRLLDAGVDKARLFQEIEESFRPARLALAARALASLRYARDGDVAIQSLGPADFAETGGKLEELTGIVNTPMTVGSVRVSILLTQSAAGETKLSFRSKPAPDGGAAYDVNELAGRFGGGGHRFAAGARVAATLPGAETRLLEVLAGFEPG